MGFTAPAGDLVPRTGPALNQFGDPIVGTTPVPANRVQDLGDAIINGLQNSATGLAIRGEMPEQQLDENAPWYHRIGAGVGMIAGDLPISVAGAAAATPTGPVGQMAAAFAAPMALREALVEAYNNDHALSWKGAWEIGLASLKGGTKGAVIGAATGGAGRVVSGVLGRTTSAVGPVVPAVQSSLGRGVAATGAELVALTATSGAVEQHMPTWQDFMDNAILLGGMKGAVAIAKRLRNIYAETGRTPEQVLADAAKDPAIALDLKPIEAPSTKEPMVDTWHGSPYKFDVLDATKIGTGEGMQAYGHGLYVGEAKGTGINYIDSAKGGVGRGAEARDVATRVLKANGYDVEKAVAELNKRAVDAGDPAFAVKMKDAVAAIRAGEVGNLYRVQIPQRVVDTMLDWDKPLDQQAPFVQEAMRAAGFKDMRITGEQAHDALVEGIGGEGASSFATSFLNSPGWQRQVSDFLKGYGIRGVKYLDNASRKAGEGTRNYVLFDANDARVIERNGQPIGATQQPSAYAPLALEQRIKAALDADPRPEMVRAMLAGSDKPPKLGEAPIADPVKYEYITDADTAKGVLRAVTELYQREITTQTRDVVPNKATAIEGMQQVTAGAIGPHIVGKAGNAAEIYARAHLLKGATNDAVAQLGKIANIAEADLTPTLKLQALAALERVAMLKAEIEGVGAEAGRALQIFRAIKRDPSMLGDAETLLKIAERKGKLQDIAALAQSLKDPAQMAEFAREYTKATTSAQVLEVWKAAILSGPDTHLANNMGNLLKWSVEIPESAIAAAFTAAERAMRGDPLTMQQYKARALAPIYGVQFGARDALTVAAEIWRGKGAHLEKADVYQAAIPGKPGEVIRIPFKLLQVEDALFRTVAERAESHIMAIDRAVKEGFDPRTSEYMVRVQQLTQRPELGLSEKAAQEAITRVQQAGAEGVFAQRLGPRMEAVSRAIQGSLVEYIIPFRRTPINLLSWAVQHTPGLNFMSARWRADYAAGGERRSRAAARVVIGAGLSTTAYTLAQEGLLTGSGQFDEEQRRTKAAAGEQPNSIKVGDKYYSYQRLEPVAKVLDIAANLIELQKATKDPEDRAKIASLLVLMFGNATVSTTYLSGLSNVMNAVTDTPRYGETFLEQYASSVVPKIVGQTIAKFDPYKREVDGVMDAIQSQIPILREKLLPKRDVWGEPVKNEKLFGVMPVQKTQESKDKVRTEAVRLQLAITDAPKFLTEKGPFKPGDKRIELTPEQRDIFRQVAGKNAMALLAPIVNAPDWDRIPDFAKAAIYKDIIQGARAQGAYAALPPDDAARAALRQKIVDKIIQQTRDAESR